MRWSYALALLVASSSFAAEPETFFGWSKDGSWLVYEERGRDERVDLYFCQSEEAATPSWPSSLNELEREDQNGLSCVRFLDPNKAPYQWKNQLVLPPVATQNNGVVIQQELVPDGETPGFVLVSGEKKESCYASGMRESSKLQKSWFHPSGRYVAVMIDGSFRHCVSTLKATPLKSPKVPKPIPVKPLPKKPTGKKR